ncbi:hypothetical protein CK5_19600 [Blautia obeum A2-162]|uniref:Uncharacterized protein n=1 Tax=Blautia obeum A2-162 TaxID=657314 RepID=D4LRD4_9FIRM|nr:hypothetical protein CK5_19600 [Blautia obeum A2-162]
MSELDMYANAYRCVLENLKQYL